MVAADLSDYLERAFGVEQVRMAIGHAFIGRWTKKRPLTPLHLVGPKAPALRTALRQMAGGGPMNITVGLEKGQTTLEVELETPGYNPFGKLAAIWTEYQDARDIILAQPVAFRRCLEATTMRVLETPMPPKWYEIVPACWASWACLCTGGIYVGNLPAPDIDLDALDLTGAIKIGQTLYLAWDRIEPRARELLGHGHAFEQDGQTQRFLSVAYREDLAPLFKRYSMRNQARPVRSKEPPSGI